jgi:hypothetical protein
MSYSRRLAIQRAQFVARFGWRRKQRNLRVFWINSNPAEPTQPSLYRAYLRSMEMERRGEPVITRQNTNQTTTKMKCKITNSMIERMIAVTAAFKMPEPKSAETIRAEKIHELIEAASGGRHSSSSISSALAELLTELGLPVPPKPDPANDTFTPVPFLCLFVKQPFTTKPHRSKGKTVKDMGEERLVVFTNRKNGSWIKSRYGMSPEAAAFMYDPDDQSHVTAELVSKKPTAEEIKQWFTDFVFNDDSCGSTTNSFRDFGFLEVVPNAPEKKTDDDDDEGISEDELPVATDHGDFRKPRSNC